MSKLPVDPYDRTKIVEPPIDNPDRAPLGGTGKDFVVTLTDTTETPGADNMFLSRSGKWVVFGTTELTSWGNIVGDITNQADLMAMFDTKADTSDLHPVAFSGNYNQLINKPPLGTVSPINLNGLSSYVLHGDGFWRIPTDVNATWGNINGDINAQTDLMALLNAKAPSLSPVFTGTPRAPTPSVDDNSDRIATTGWFFGQAFNGTPQMDGVASSGDSTLWARGNHRHPTDTTKIDDAPNDGSQYARQSQAWTIVAATGGGGGGGRSFYFATSDASDIATYYTLLPMPSQGTERTLTAPCTGTSDFLLGSFITDPGVPGPLNVEAGSVSRRIYAATSAGVARLHLRVYIRNAAGVETLIRDEFSNSFVNSSAGLQEWLATVAAAGVLLPTDRVVAKLYAQRVSGAASITVTAYFEGTSHASYVQTTFSGLGTMASNDFTVDDAMPSTPIIGDRWVKPSTGEEMVRIPTVAGPDTWLNPAAASALPLPLSVANGGTSGTTIATALTGLGIPNHNLLAVSLTGAATVSATPLNWAVLNLNKPASGYSSVLYGKTNAQFRWGLHLGNNAAESGSNVGSDFIVDRFNDAGSYVDSPLKIDRGTGVVSFQNPASFNSSFNATGTTLLNGTLIVQSNIELGGNASGAVPFIDFHSAAAGVTDYDGRIICSGGGPLAGQGAMSYGANTHTFIGNIYSDNPLELTNDSVALRLRATNTWTKGLRCGGSGALEIVNHANSAVNTWITDTGRVFTNEGYACRSGMSGSHGGNCFNIYWDGVAKLWVDATYVGQFSFVSDERVKHRIEPMPLLNEEAFAAIEPIRFHWADISIFKDDGRPHWGFSAQNIEKALPEALLGDTSELTKDGDPQPASIDDRAILAQTVLQVQDLIRRIKALEKA